MNPLDKLFSEKLGHHAVAPSAEAWTKVEASLSKKNKGIVWMRWAAVFVIGSTLATWYVLGSEESQPMIVETVVQQKQEPTTVQPLAQSTESKETSKTEVVKSKLVTSKRKKVNLAPAPVQPAEVVPQEQVALVEQPEVTEQVAQAVTPVVEEMKPIVLTYTLATVEAPTKAEVVAKKETPIKRAWEFAKNVKNGETTFSIRDMKDELFALDLRKKESKNQ